jgi:hypothetical protein
MGTIRGQSKTTEQKMVPRVAEVTGLVSRYDRVTQTYLPIPPGYLLTEPTLLVISEGSALLFSCPGRISGQVFEHSRIVIGPAVNGRCEAELRLGTVTVSLDPDRPSGKPTFAVRSLNGVVEAKGTLFAVTEYNGQTYTAVKKGEIKKKTLPPGQPDFSAYLRGAKPKPAKPQPGITGKKE